MSTNLPCVLLLHLYFIYFALSFPLRSRGMYHPHQHQHMQFVNQAAVAGRHSLPQPPQHYPPIDLSRIPPVSHDAALQYDAFVTQLTFNSKELITNLTRIAGENLSACPAICAVIEQRIHDVPPGLKLPLLYLMDSILKNIGPPFVNRFAVNVFNVFTNTYSLSPPQVRASMHRLLNTWPPIFGHDLVNAMRQSVHDQDMANTSHYPHLHVPPPPSLMHPRPNFGPKEMVATYPFQANSFHMPNPVPSQALAPPPPSSLGHLPPVPRLPPSQYPGFPANSLPKPPIQLRSMPQAQAPLPFRGQFPSSGPPYASSTPSFDRPNVGPVEQSAEQRRIMSQAVPGAPTGGSNNVPPPSQKFLHTQEMMREISRKASLGTLPSSHQLFNMNRLITTQLQSAGTPPPHRNILLTFQQQLRELAATPRLSAPALSHPRPPSEARIPSVPPAIPNPPSGVFPNLNQLKALNPELVNAIGMSQAMSGLLRTMPRAALQNTRPSVNNPLTSNVSTAPPFPHVEPPVRVVAPPLFSVPAPIALKFSNIKTMSHSSVVRSLYVELPHLSNSDGMRFSTKEKLRDHLDWLFRRNRRKRAISNNETLGDLSRCWFDRLDEFLCENKNSDVAKGTGDAQKNGNSATPKGQDNGNSGDTESSVPLKEENEKCQACEEIFETFWDVDKQNWMLADAMRTEDGDVYHPNCWKSMQKASESSESSDSDEDGIPGDKETPAVVKSESADTNDSTLLQSEPKLDVAQDRKQPHVTQHSGENVDLKNPQVFIKKEESSLKTAGEHIDLYSNVSKQEPVLSGVGNVSENARSMELGGDPKNSVSAKPLVPVQSDDLKMNDVEINTVAKNGLKRLRDDEPELHTSVSNSTSTVGTEPCVKRLKTLDSTLGGNQDAMKAGNSRIPSDVEGQQTGSKIVEATDGTTNNEGVEHR